MTESYEPEDLLGKPITKDYVPSFLPSHFQIHRTRPPFSSLVIREMLTDPRIIFGLWLIKGPIITNSKFEIQTARGDVEEFIKNNLTRFWRNSAARALKAIEWGYSGSEVLYRTVNGQVQFDVLKDLEPLDCRAVTSDGQFVGMWVMHVPAPNRLQNTIGEQKIYIGGPKCLWFIHGREKHPWYGISRLHGAHVPWWEQWSDGGYRDIRRLWFYKNSFEGGVIYHPPGITRTKEGLVVSYRDLARELMEKKRTGGTLAFPNQMQDTKRSWEYEPPSANPVPSGLLEYGELLRKEVFEGMGIPSEVIESSGEQGFGSASGRQVPQLAFFSTLQEIVQWLVTDFSKQVLDVLLEINFGEGIEYDIVVLPITDEASQSQQQEQQPGKPDKPGEEEAGDIGLPPGKGGGGNSPQSGGGNPLTRTQQERGVATGYEARRTQALRKKAPLRMAQVASTGAQDLGPGKWITIGGSSGRSEEGKAVQHKGGMKVFLSKDGKVLAGGPRALRGKHVSEADNVLSRLGQRPAPRAEERAAAQAEAKQPVEEVEPVTYTSTDLPPETSPLTAVLEDAVGSDPEDQQGFLEYLKEAHAELTQEATTNDKLAQLADNLEAGLSRETNTTVKNLDTNQPSKQRKVVRRDLKYAKDWNDLVKKVKKAVPEVDTNQLRDTARELWQSEYESDYQLQEAGNQVRRKFYQQFGLTPAQVQNLMDRGYDYASKLKTTGAPVLPGFDEMARSAAYEFPEYAWTDRDDEQQIGEDVWNLVSSQREPAVHFTDKRFVAEALRRLAEQGDLPTGQGALPLHHPHVVHRALRKWDDETSFNPDEFA